MGRGRKPVTERIPLTRFRLAYLLTGNVRDAGRLLGVSYGVVARVLRENGMALPRMGIRTRKRYTRRFSGAFARWLEEHPDAKLPHTAAEIARVTGVSYGSVKFFLYRRRKRMREFLATIPDLRKHHIFLRDEEGVLRDTAFIGSYRYTFSKLTLAVTLRATTTYRDQFVVRAGDPVAFKQAVEKRIQEQEERDAARRGRGSA